MSTQHRPSRRPPTARAPSRRPRWRHLEGWRLAGLRVLAVVVIVAVGAGVWVGVRRAEALEDAAAEQRCTADAFRRSLDERSKATDALLAALLTVNRGVQDPDPEVRAEARATFDREARRIGASRASAQDDTARYRREAGCA